MPQAVRIVYPARSTKHNMEVQGPELATGYIREGVTTAIYCGLWPLYLGILIFLTGMPPPMVDVRRSEQISPLLSLNPPHLMTPF